MTQGLTLGYFCILIFKIWIWSGENEHEDAPGFYWSSTGWDLGCTAPQPPEAWPLSLAGAPAQGGSHVLSVFVPLSVIVSVFDCVFAFMISCGLSLFNPHVAIDLKKNSAHFSRRISHGLNFHGFQFPRRGELWGFNSWKDLSFNMERKRPRLMGHYV